MWLPYCCPSCPIKSHEIFLKSTVQRVVGQASPRLCWRNCLKFVRVSMLLSAKPQREKLWQSKSQRTEVSAQLDPSLFTIFVTLCQMCTSMSVSLEPGSPGLDATHQMFFTSAEQRRIISLDLLAKLFLMQPKKLFTFLDAKVHCGCVFNFAVQKHQQDVFLPINLQSCQPPAHLGTWGCSSSAAGLVISLCLNIMTFLLAHFSSLLRSLWMAAQISDSSTTPISCKLAVGALWSHRPGEEIKQYRSRYQSHNIPLAAGLQMDFVLLIRALWSQLFCQFSVHLTVRLLKSVAWSVFLWSCYRR